MSRTTVDTREEPTAPAAGVHLSRVGVEVGYIGPARAGVARYFWNLLGELVSANPGTEFLLYSAWPVEIPLARGNWRRRVQTGIKGLPFELWIQHDLPRMLAEDRVEAFWGQGYVMPQRAFGRCARILTLYDLVPVLFPSFMAR
ncbi:glycosyltransferase family 4 protein, partial [candidate division WOR-3 bacterium]|nr:glycosyltransferase family 4 protein [candidate division WOR-3 bacterium]